MSQTKGTPVSIKQALQSAANTLQHSDTARLDAQLLLCHVLGVERPYLVAHDDRLLTAPEREHYQALVERRADDEPIAYIVGHKHFWDMDFIVSPAVLVPRPETEHLVEAALDWLRARDHALAADIGTGSGAIAITVARHSTARMIAVDLSPDALDIAQMNAARHQVTVQFFQGSLAQPLIDGGIKVDLLMANLPYIATDELSRLRVTRHEPALALDGGADGLDLVRELLLQVPAVCNPSALILFEIGMEQGQAVLDFAQQHLHPASASLVKDLAGHDRIVRIQL